jgi:NAD+ diphosphatase
MFYTHGALDRADHLRTDADAIKRLRNADSTRLVPVWRGTLLVTSPATDHSGKGVPTSLASLESSHSAPDAIFLGLIEDVAWFAWSVSELDDEARRALANKASDDTGKPVSAEFADLRVSGPNLHANEGALLAFARALIWWQEKTNFCSQCAGPLRSTNAGHVRQCENEHTHFPRTDPAVIMLVTRQPEDGSDEQILLGRNANWPDGVYSTLAGFVEPGESLEQAVMREVHEEAGIFTEDVRYVASQPWPFPRSIMLGFEARAINSDIRCEPTELADARWFTREDLKHFGVWGDQDDGFKLPRPDSIARFLVDRWIERSDS